MTRNEAIYTHHVDTTVHAAITVTVRISPRTVTVTTSGQDGKTIHEATHHTPEDQDPRVLETKGTP